MTKPNRLLTADQVRGLILKDIQRMGFKRQGHYADHLGVSRAFVSMVLAGSKPPSGAVLDQLGLESVIQPIKYRRITK